MTNGTTRYNCSIIDVYDNRVVASQSGTSITSRLAIDTLQKALLLYYPSKGLILLSDQESRFTSKSFSDFCKQRLIQQSMSRAGCPYDNAVRERYFNALKHECTNHYSFTTKEKMDSIMNVSAKVRIQEVFSLVPGNKISYIRRCSSYIDALTSD